MHSPRPGRAQFIPRAVRSTILPIMLFSLVFGVFGCGSEDNPVSSTPSGLTFRDLSDKVHVLFNLELAWEVMDLAEYEKLLDDAFIFRYTEWISAGEWDTREWDKDTEGTVLRKMFGEEPPPSYLEPLTNVRLSFSSSQDWEAVAPQSTPQLPGEMWFERTVGYFLAIEAGPKTFVAIDRSARITIRFDVTCGMWKIVLFEDDLEHLSTRARPAAAAKRGTTWGQVKAIYNP